MLRIWCVWSVALVALAGSARALTCPSTLPGTSSDTAGLNGYLWANDVGCVTGVSTYQVDSIAVGIGNNKSGRIICSVYTRSGTTLTEVSSGCRTADTDANSACSLNTFCEIPLVSPSSCILAANTSYLPACLFSSGATDITFSSADGRWFVGGQTYPTLMSTVTGASHSSGIRYAYYLNLTAAGGPTPTPTVTPAPTPTLPGSITVDCPSGVTVGSTCTVVP